MFIWDIYELRVTSYELKNWKKELKFKNAISNTRVTSSILNKALLLKC